MTFNNHKKHFNSLHHQRYIHNVSDDSPRPIFRASIQCSTIPKFIHMPLVTRFHQPLRHSNISSPNIHSSFISEKTNSQTAVSMSSDSSSASSETSMTLDLSSTSSKASLKGITQLPSEIIFNIYSNSVNYILHCTVKILNVNMVLWPNLSFGLPKFCLAFVSACLGFLSLLLFSCMYQTKTSSLVHLFDACTDIFWLIHIINFYFKN